MNRMDRIIRMASKKYIKDNNVTTCYLHNNHVAINIRANYTDPKIENHQQNTDPVNIIKIA